MKNARMLDRKMCRTYALLVCLGLVLSNSCASYLRAQAPETDLILHVQTTLALVDGVAEHQDPATHKTTPLTSLEMTDFRLFDKGREVAISTFDQGASTRPIALWLIVQCNMGFPEDWASGFLRGKTQYFKSSLQHLNKDDLVGVSHWCDNGEANIDVPPGTDVDAALKGVEDVLGTNAILGNNRSGELAMQRMILMVDEMTRKSKPPQSLGLKIRPETGNSRLPIFLFLYGDHGATFTAEADAIISDVLETSGMIFGLSETEHPWGLESTHESEEYVRGQSQYDLRDKTWNLVRYYSQNTGGEYYANSHPESFAPLLDYIITQVHLRYTLGFKPAKLDGKMHELRVELTKDAQKRFPKTTLRFRSEYIPLKPAQ
jgi:hypothetical protein